MAELVEVSAQIGVAVGDAGVRGVPQPGLRPFAIARRGARGLELLHVALPNGAEVLPMFSSERAAQDFLASQNLGGTWYARECYAGELVSLMLGLYAGIDGVVMDPVPGDPVEGDAPENFVYWESFVSRLLGDGRTAPSGLAPRRVAYAGGS